MALSVKNMLGGGGKIDITNGTIEEYYSKSGTIPKNTFVKVELPTGIQTTFEQSWGGSTTYEQTYSTHDVCFFKDKVVKVNMNGVSAKNVELFNVGVDGKRTLASSVNIFNAEDYMYYPSICVANDESGVIITAFWGTELRAVKIDINGNTMTVGNVTVIYTYASSPADATPLLVNVGENQYCHLFNSVNKTYNCITFTLTNDIFTLGKTATGTASAYSTKSKYFKVSDSIVISMYYTTSSGNMMIIAFDISGASIVVNSILAGNYTALYDWACAEMSERSFLLVTYYSNNTYAFRIVINSDSITINRDVLIGNRSVSYACTIVRTTDVRYFVLLDGFVYVVTYNKLLGKFEIETAEFSFGALRHIAFKESKDTIVVIGPTGASTSSTCFWYAYRLSVSGTVVQASGYVAYTAPKLYYVFTNIYNGKGYALAEYSSSGSGNQPYFLTVAFDGTKIDIASSKIDGLLLTDATETKKGQVCVLA